MTSQNIVFICAKVVDYVLMSGEEPTIEKFISKIESKFKLGAIVIGRGSLSYYGLNMTQNEEGISVDVDAKLAEDDVPVISRMRRLEPNDKLDEIELQRFRPITSRLS